MSQREAREVAIEVFGAGRVYHYEYERDDGTVVKGSATSEQMLSTLDAALEQAGFSVVPAEQETP